MAEPLKNIYNRAFFEQLTSALTQVLKGFDSESFIEMVQNEEWQTLELKDRMYKITSCLRQVFPRDLRQSLLTIDATIQALRAQGCREQGFEYMFLPDFVEKYGIDHPDESLSSLRSITMFVSSEFAVRPFIDRYPQTSLDFLLTCAQDSNHHVRRWASEGCRPLLPWSMVLQDLKKDPSPILPILELLMDDASEYVRRSVANNLNDISKNHPDLVLSFCKKWIGRSKATDKLIKHGLRTLLKAGNTEALTLFGIGPDPSLVLSAFSLVKPKVAMGHALQMNFNLANTSEEEKSVRIEYAMYFLRKNGIHSKKVFKLSERNLKSHELISLEKRHIFRPITTRTYYPGVQKCSVIINGIESKLLEFILEV